MDSDGDGVSDGIENLAPNNGDGNNDQTPDKSQGNFASLPNAVDGRYVTLACLEPLQLKDVTATTVSPIAPPEELHFPLGFFSFRISNAPKGPILLALILPDGVTFDTYWKYGPLPGPVAEDWYPFNYDNETGAVFAFEEGIVFLWLKDGARGDDDLQANGQVIDIGGPALGPVSVKDWMQY